MFGNTNKELEKAFEQPTDSNPLEHVVMWQKRHKISNEHCTDFGEWQEWENCDIDDYNNVRALIEAGYNYEVRELVVAT